MENIYRKWKLINRHEINADDLVLERIRKYPLPRLRLIPEKFAHPLIRINNDESPDYTILEIETEDNFGLLHRIARYLNHNKIDIASAHLSTRAYRAFDVFYVRNYDGSKISDTAKINELKSDLAEALAR
jgi:[protein-PII] uridylyltransferase